MIDLNSISAQEIGRRLRLARENAGITQQEAAQIIGISRPTLVSIEQGTRRVRIHEIQSLAYYYQVTVNSLLRREAVHTSLVPRFRKLVSSNDAQTEEAVQVLNTLVKAEVELENLLGIELKKNYPPERGISDGNVIDLAEQHAQELRNWLGLGIVPIAEIFSLIELEIGIRLYQRRLSSDSKVAGLFAYDDDVGACILLNANQPLERRVFSAAHELGHFMGTRRAPEILNDDERFQSRDERYANAFGSAFLMPQQSFQEKFRQITAGAEKLTRRHVILLSHLYHISREACVRRLEGLHLVKKGTWSWFKDNGGISNAQAREVLGEAVLNSQDPTKDEAFRPLPYRISLMANQAWRQGLMSEGQLVSLLNVPRVDLRMMLDNIELADSTTHEILKLPNR